MTDTALLEREAMGAAAMQRTASRADDKAMLKAAADLTRDLNVARANIYWADLIGSALLGYQRRLFCLDSLAGNQGAVVVVGYADLRFLGRFVFVGVDRVTGQQVV